MKVDKIIKNAKIFTSNMDSPKASALVVKESCLYMWTDAMYSQDLKR